MIKKNKKRKQLTNKRKRFLIANAFLALFLFIGIGYSALDTNLNIFGNIQMKKYERNTLYNVLKNEASSGGLAREYTGEHQDSINSSHSKYKIYHWYANNDTDATAVLDKNNVIFANHCWQIIRTTDTGGVKMMYNGEAVNGKCLKNREAPPQYMRGDPYRYVYSDYYYFGKNYEYDRNSKTFSITGDLKYATWNDETAPDLIGRWICSQSGSKEGCDRIVYIIRYRDYRYAYVLFYGKDDRSDMYDTIGEESFKGGDYTNIVNTVHLGWKHNDNYPIISTSNSLSKYESDILKYNYSDLRTTYWYSDEIKYDSNTDKYSLVNPYKVSSASELLSLKGKYTLLSTTETDSDINAYYLTQINSASDSYYLRLSNGQKLEDINTNYTYGDSYTANSDGTYTINSGINFSRVDYYDYKDLLNSKYICKNPVNNKCEKIWKVDNAYNSSFSYKDSTTYIYSKKVSYANGKYTLDKASSITIDIDNVTSGLNYQGYYSCFNNTGTCENIEYINFISDKNIFYTELSNGEYYDIEKKNLKDSRVKKAVDLWFEHNLKNYSNYLEDTVFCNDRTVKSVSSSSIKYQTDLTDTNLKCPDIYDMFSVNNDKAKLDYPVGLLTLQEVNLLNNINIYKSNDDYYLLTPLYGNYMNEVGTSGIGQWGMSAESPTHIRPAISLKSTTKYTSGTGTMDDPYVVDTSN